MGLVTMWLLLFTELILAWNPGQRCKGRAADLLEVDARLGLGLGVLRYQVRSKLSAWLRPTSASVVVMCLMISSSASLQPNIISVRFQN